eukprot:CAMPEP_0115590268 /NCGR_PEP_ID=MMETSP0272-20121206/9678_1 /TAXON_ID=71861 /ORGANISM="Scrippsiella trochoidea, Strain CCMP3099" /LENGTH=684 /DNA_ID=CAMNT_0003025461 /DNA_START=60 /DNA_END=2112 /DNA_ORIENTATION=+
MGAFDVVWITVMATLEACSGDEQVNLNWYVTDSGTIAPGGGAQVADVISTLNKLDPEVGNTSFGNSMTENPFRDKLFYVNPRYEAEFQASIASSYGHVQNNLQKMQQVPSAYWVDTKAKLIGNTMLDLEWILADASSKSPPELVVLMWYNLPNRDCDGNSSAGEICCSRKLDGSCDYLQEGDCAQGIEEYKKEYADPFIALLQRYEARLPIVVVLEPDSIPNIATNSAHPQCGTQATHDAYLEGIRYALERLTQDTPLVAVYLDAAHGGWLGWEDNLEKFMRSVQELQFPMSKIRGFATNVANYQPLGVPCPFHPDKGGRNNYCLNGRHKGDPCCDDPCRLEPKYNPANNEMNYAQELAWMAKALLHMDAHMIIDTGRNGVPDMRSSCQSWCNPRGAGAGVPSTAKTADPSLVDAYFWLKTPGESDGCGPTGFTCRRTDEICDSKDALGSQPGEQAPPEAGGWYDFQVKDLALNARFDPPKPVERPPSPPPVTVATMGGSYSHCAAIWQQCGGSVWSGATCCQPGCQCDFLNTYYSQCKPPVGSSRCVFAQPAAPAVTYVVRRDASQPQEDKQLHKDLRKTGPGHGPITELIEEVALRSAPCWVAISLAAAVLLYAVGRRLPGLRRYDRIELRRVELPEEVDVHVEQVVGGPSVHVLSVVSAVNGAWRMSEGLRLVQLKQRMTP